MIISHYWSSFLTFAILLKRWSSGGWRQVYRSVYLDATCHIIGSTASCDVLSKSNSDYLEKGRFSLSSWVTNWTVPCNPVLSSPKYWELARPDYCLPHIEFASDGMPAALVVHGMATMVSLSNALPARDSASLQQIGRRTQCLDQPWQQKIDIYDEIQKD